MLIILIVLLVLLAVGGGYRFPEYRGGISLTGLLLIVLVVWLLLYAFPTRF